MAPYSNDVAGQWRVCLIDDDADLRDAVTDLFAILNADCLALPSMAAMIERADEVLACKVVILDVNLGEGQPSGVDAYDWLRPRAFAGRIVFLTGHGRSHPAVADAVKRGVRVLSKPIESAELRALLDDDAR